MALIGRLHPLIVHFPIALVIIAALIAATVLVIVTAHLGGVLVWGADFLRP
jgi:uncharacterized membrane protein